MTPRERALIRAVKRAYLARIEKYGLIKGYVSKSNAALLRACERMGWGIGKGRR